MSVGIQKYRLYRLYKENLFIYGFSAFLIDVKMKSHTKADLPEVLFIVLHESGNLIYASPERLS